LFLVVFTAICEIVQAAPYRPTSADVVLETLPAGTATLRTLRQNQIAASNGKSVSLDEAMLIARRYIELGQTQSDPRYYGYAEAALQPWWSQPGPSGLRVMRARILQFRHQFLAALAELEPALQNDQFNGDAWLLFAVIEQVQGNVSAARAACLKVIPISDPLVGSTCVASVGAMSGKSEKSAALLQSALHQATAADASTRIWAWTTLGEIQARRGLNNEAEAAFKQALAITPDDVYALAAYSDLLLQTQRASAVMTVLATHRQADALLLRLAIAAMLSHDAEAGALRDALAQRFTEARERGDEAHLREQARFTLELDHDAISALSLAQKNWKVQHEAADAELLLAAALAAQQPQAAQPVLDWLKSTGIEDVRAAELVKRLGAGAKP
jgi:tetratricopeptide (TPR) repeat protein